MIASSNQDLIDGAEADAITVFDALQSHAILKCGKCGARNLARFNKGMVIVRFWCMHCRSATVGKLKERLA